jgi:hypothetical protein
MHLAGKRAMRTSALSGGQSRGLQADAHTGNGYKRSRRTLHFADREVDKSLTRRPYEKFQRKVKVEITS